MITPEAIEGFSAVGMTELSSLIRTTASGLGKRFPRARDRRWDALLAAGDLPVEEVEAIFAKSKNFYIAFVECTRGLGWDQLNKSIYGLSAKENGGFDIAATRYLKSLKLI